MIDHITTILWDMEILKKVYSAGSQVKLLLTTDPIMLGSVNIILVSTYKTSTLQVFYHFKNIRKLLFIIQTSSTWFHVNLILHTIYVLIEQLSHMKFSYLPLKKKLAFIYWTINILHSLISIIQSQIHHPVINFH